MLRSRLAVLAVLAPLSAAHAAGPPTPEAAVVHDTQQARFRLETLAEKLDSPWSLAFLPEGSILVTERIGRLRVIDPVRGLRRAPVIGLPDLVTGEHAGLMDLALHPDFVANRLLYFTYVGSGRNGTNGVRVARGRLSEDLARLTGVEIIFAAEPDLVGLQTQYGTRLRFAPDGTLFVTVGDRYVPEYGQDPTSHLGTVVRLTDTGAVPPDNPFAAGPAGWRPEIYTYGHRNPQGLAIHPETGAVWTHEHGPRGGDEVNILTPGANYGWPAVSYGINYEGTPVSPYTSLPGMEEPVLYWAPSIAPSGMEFYTGDRFPEWHGDLFVGALSGTHLRRLELHGDRVIGQEVLLDNLDARIRDVRTGPDGLLYLVIDSWQGEVYRLVPVTPVMETGVQVEHATTGGP